MAEVLRLPSKMLQQCPVTEEVETPLHCSVCPTISTSDETTGKERPQYLKVVEQRDIQQIVKFKEQVEDEIEELKDQIRRIGRACSRRQEYEQLIEQAEKKIPTEELWRTGRMRFGNRPSEGINFLIEHGLLNRAPEDVAVFLYEGADILNKVSIGVYFGSAKEFNQKVLKCFVQQLHFTKMDLVNALRLYLNSFVLPGESQQIDRMMETFATRYCSCNPGIFSCADTCYVLSFSIIMLNTGLHNPNVKDKPTIDSFITMNRGLDNGQDLPQELLMAYYESIKKEALPRPKGGSDLAETFFSPDHQGWLVKEGGRHKTWKKRWFILTDNCLYYFKFPQDKGPLGIIPLENLKIRDCNDSKKFMFEIYQENIAGMSISDGIKSCKKDAKKGVVTGNHDVYRIQAQSENDKAIWMKNIQACIHRSPVIDLLQQRRQAASLQSKSSQTVSL